MDERKMFGGLAFMINGHMCCGIVGNDMVVRTGPDGLELALSRAAHGLHRTSDERFCVRRPSWVSFGSRLESLDPTRVAVCAAFAAETVRDQLRAPESLDVSSLQQVRGVFLMAPTGNIRGVSRFLSRLRKGLRGDLLEADFGARVVERTLPG